MPARAKLFSNEFDEPVFLTAPPGDTRRVFVVERKGKIKIADRLSGSVRQQSFLHLTDIATGFNEQGLLGLAFHPEYEQNGFFYVYFTAHDRSLNIVRYRVSEDRNLAASTSATKVIRIAKRQDGQFLNHNGGWIGFRLADGLLYAGIGDGGPLAGNDPDRHGQNKGSLLGKILRLDVNADAFPEDAERTYSIPTHNPFVNQAGARPEVWAYGLRNPWRCSFDRTTGDLIIADVGQSQREELNFEPAASQGGVNYGWRAKEGTRVTNLDNPLPTDLHDPVHEYGHDQGSAIIGGYVYRGQRVAAEQGSYWFADTEGTVWSCTIGVGSVTALQQRTPTIFGNIAASRISSFGEDAEGDLYILDLGGSVFRLEP